VQKIRDIDHHKHIADAIHHYQTTIKTISDLFGDHAIYGRDLLAFKKVEEKFDLEYETAYTTYTNNQAFENLQHNTIGSQPPFFRGFEDSPSWFRNGILHLRMNDHPNQYQWMLK
jgi:hypothetical protein